MQAAWWVLGVVLLLTACTATSGWNVTALDRVISVCTATIFVETGRAPTEAECQTLVFALREQGCGPEEVIRWISIKAAALEPREDYCQTPTTSPTRVGQN